MYSRFAIILPIFVLGVVIMSANIRKKGIIRTFAISFNMFCEMTLQEAIEAQNAIKIKCENSNYSHTLLFFN
jgi:hypothetical protein